MGDECSLRAGMPSAQEWIQAIKTSYPQAYNHASPKNLKNCSAELTVTQKAEIFETHLQKSKVGWAHLCAALLMKEGYISRVYTTSPDPLLERACTLVDVFPTVYDCTVGTITKPDLIPPKAIIHLNGQVLGAVPGPLDGVFSGAGRYGPWLIIGYNPDPQDPVYEQIAWLDQIHNGLLWVFSGNRPPPGYIQDQVFNKASNQYTHAEDPDTFLVSLIRMMKMGSPDLISFPFTFLGHWLKKVSSYPAPGQKEGLIISDISIKQTRAAIQQYEGPERASDIGEDEEAAGGVDDPDLLKAIQAARTGLMAGKPQKIIEQHKQYEETPSIQLGHLLHWAYQVEGDTALEEAAQLSGQQALEKLRTAQARYEMALSIQPDSAATLFKVGQLMVEQAEVLSDKTSPQIWGQAAEQFQKALKLNPDLFEARYGLGMVLTDLAGQKSDQESDALYESATREFQEGLRIQPNHPDAAYGAGHLLFIQARRKKGAEAVRLYTQAMEMLKIALQGNSGRIEAILELGQSLFILSKTKKGDDADRFLMMAEEKFQQAVQIDTAHAEAQFGWADVLMERASLKNDEMSDRLFSKAFEKYQEVLKLKPDMHRVNFRWGVGQYNLARKKSGKEAVDLLKEAAAKFEQGLERNPKSIEIMTRLGRLYFELGNLHKGANADTLYSQSMDHFFGVIKLQPKNFEALSQVGNVSYQLSMNKEGREAENLLKASIEKYQDALKIKADYSWAIVLWGNALFRLASLKEDGTGDKLFDEAEKKYEQALKIHPNDTTALTNFGSILLKRAKNLKADQVGNVLEKAVHSFQAAIEVQENNPEALNMMGEVLIAQAKSKRGINAHPLLAEAKGVLHKAEEHQPGSGCYNMARLQAQLANETGCRQWLERCRQHDVLPEPEALNQEILFTSVRESKWFKNLVTAKAPQEEKKEKEGAPKKTPVAAAGKEPGIPSKENSKPAANA